MMRTRIPGGLLIAATLVMVVALVGPAHGQGNGIVEPLVITLIDTARGAGPGVGGDAEVVLKRSPGKVTVHQAEQPIGDLEGNFVGTHLWDCTNSKQVAWFCTMILDLNAGPYTEEGTIVLQGTFEGFSGERLAVTGGTGAYANVRGDATLSTTDGEYFRTLRLIP